MMCGMKPARLIELLSRGDELPVQWLLKERRRDRSEENHDVMDEQVQLVRPAVAVDKQAPMQLTKKSLKQASQAMDDGSGGSQTWGG